MNFWKTFGASMLAWIVGFGLLFVVTIFTIVGMIVSLVPKQEDNSVNSDSILCLYLDDKIVDSPSISLLDGLDPVSMNVSESLPILQVLAAIENAATDDNIKGIYINITGTGTISTANAEELREAIKRFKQSGKFVVAYDDTYTQLEYYIASVADCIILNPEGSLEWQGASMGVIFYKGMLDKLGVTVDVFRPTACKYKSAVEPFILTKMSEANRKQSQELVDSVWESLCMEVAQSRNIDAKQLAQYAENLAIAFPEDALKAGMIDMVAYEDATYEIFAAQGIKADKYGAVNKVSLDEYIASLGSTKYTTSINDNNLSLVTSPMVAIIYADGQIVDGDLYETGSVYGTRLARELRKARKDDNTKAVVLRVNSPGGSALASEVAWHEMVLLQQVKPVVVSMGDMAASGGYYISAPADYIFADRLTLTGSIGVFGMMPNFENLLSKRLGITYDAASTSPAAEGITLITPLNNKQRNYLMKGVDRVYTTFTEHVAEGRNLSIEHVLNIAEGRVWSGAMAKEIGLVDEIGGLNSAIAKAVELADLDDDYKIYEFVAPYTPFEEWLNSMGMVYANAWGVDYNIYGEEIRQILKELNFITSIEGIRTEVVGNVKIEL